ncbi:MAG: acetyltransferase [Clostridia bacterium]|nr:acetyltransferase [Clostridia bacterium]
MNKRVVIIGAGGHGKVIADIARACGDIVVGFLDDAYDKETDFYGTRIIGKTDLYVNYKCDCEFIVAIGSNSIRKRIADDLSVNWYTAVHPSAQISKSAEIGEGTTVMPNAVVNADTVIGRHCIINTGAVIEHDCEIGDYTHISPRGVVCGVSKVGKNVWLGAGSIVIHVKSVCDDVVVGAGSVVTKSIEEKGTYVGIPCKRID